MGKSANTAKRPRAARVPPGEGLVHVSADMPGWSRIRHGRAFRYKDEHGRWIRDETTLARIRKLAIPPAYTQVWICPLPHGHLQATGLDARGRRQYRYHPLWRSLQGEIKFDRLMQFGAALGRIRARVRRDLSRHGGAGSAAPTREVVVATLVYLLDTTYLRVGNEPYVESNNSYGLSTLRNRHARISGGTLVLRFRGKGGVFHEASVDDPRVVRIVRQCRQLPGQELFQYRDTDGALHAVGSADINAYLQEVSGDVFTAKDFRTWHASVLALELTRQACERARDSAADGDRGRGSTPPATGVAQEVLKAVAAHLGNTPAVCRKAYVHPDIQSVGQLRLAGDPAALRRWLRIDQARASKGLQAAEARFLCFLRQLARSA